MIKDIEKIDSSLPFMASTEASVPYPTSIPFLGFNFSTPLVGSAGCVGYAHDFLKIVPDPCYGGWVLKTVTPQPLAGNPSPRVCETEAGFLNSIGLQNPGWEGFRRDYYPLLKHLDSVRIMSIAAFHLADLVDLCERASELEDIDLIELNLSCPNLDHFGNHFSCDEILLKEVVSKCAKKARKPLIVKLSPIVTSISLMARIVEEQGGDALTIANTFLGMKINVKTMEPMLAKVMGGYSGMGIKPIVMALVYQASQVVKIPIIAVGGVMKGEDVAEYLLAGASLVGVGTANLIDMRSSKRIYREFVKYLKRHNRKAGELIGQVKITSLD